MISCSLLFSLSTQRNLYINRLYKTSSRGSTTAPACAATRLLPYRLRVLLSDLCSAAACTVDCYLSDIKYLLYGNLEVHVIES